MKKVFKLFCLFFLSFSLFNAPFFGGFYLTNNVFDQDRFDTKHLFAFYINNKVNDHFSIYSRVSTGLKYYANYAGDNARLDKLSVLLNIDLLYFEFKNTGSANVSIDSKINKESSNFDLFSFRIGRIPVVQGSGFFMNMNGDGFDSFFTIKNFKFRIFTITNSLDFSRFFDFQDSSSRPIFTNWDLKRIPNYSYFAKEGNVNGFISDIDTYDYNFFFSNATYSDYSNDEVTRLNRQRYAAVLAGRLFPGFSFSLNQVFYQNFSAHFLANIDLIPNDYIVTYPQQLNNVYYTFGGKYTSMYIGLSANGKIYRGLYYAVEGIYETGFNATYYDTGSEIKYENVMINSFALYSKFSYFFDHITKPALHIEFKYAHGDPNVEFVNGTIVNQSPKTDDESKMDTNYKSPTSPSTGYVMMPGFSNLIIISVGNSVKPMAKLKNPIFNRFSIESELLLMLRPIIKGASFLSEKADFQESGSEYEKAAKAYLGVEVDLSLLWQIFSDFSVMLQGGVFIPNYYIYNDNNALFKIGLSMNVSF
ncbi:MAG: hypothetical protein MJB14_05985 [Spirochaetes bacterium]|nr:hypothetical protein [Spirochaetota bacterium]